MGLDYPFRRRAPWITVLRGLLLLGWTALAIAQVPHKPHQHQTASTNLHRKLAGSGPNEATGMPNGTPTGVRAWDGTNPFFQPAATTNYWGSGDVDGDGAVTAADAALTQQMASGSKLPLPAADVDGNGVVNAADVTLINAALSGATLPAWWNKLTTRAQRNAWVDQFVALEPTNHYTDPVWWFVCVQFSIQTYLHGAFYRNDLHGTYHDGGQTWFNLPLYSVSLSWGHAVNGILVGDNPLNFHDWRFIEPQDDTDLLIDSGYFSYGTVVDIFVPDQIQTGGTSYMGNRATVSFLMGNNGTWSVADHNPNLVFSRPVQTPVVVPDNRPDLWNPHIVPSGNGLMLFERQRTDMTRVGDIHVTDMPFADPPTAKALVLDPQFSRLLDAAVGPDQAVHLLWAGGAGYLPGVFHGILDTGTRTLRNVTRLTTTNREVHSGRLLITQAGVVHAFWAARSSNLSAGYTSGVYWSAWNGSAWTAESNVGPSSYFPDAAGSWHDPDPSRHLFDVVSEQSGSILLVWACFDDQENITLRHTRYTGSWSAPTDIEAAGMAAGVALARDAGGTVHLAYWRGGPNAAYTSFGNLLHRTLTGATWSAADTMDSSGQATGPRLVASANALYAVWVRNTGTQRIPIWKKYANAAWSAEHQLTVRAGADAYYPTADFVNGTLAIAWSCRSADRVEIETSLADERPVDLSVSLSHTGNFTQADSADTYQITVTNAGPAPTFGAVTVSDTLPAGLIAASMSGSGWTCGVSPLGCNRSDPLAASASYPVITLTVMVAANAPASVTNAVAVSGGGDSNAGNNSSTDPTTINALVTSQLLSPLPSSVLTDTSATFTWSSVPGADYYSLKVGTAQGLGDIWSRATLAVTSSVVTFLPCDGSTIWLELWTHYNGAWLPPRDYTLTACRTPPPPSLRVSLAHAGTFAQGTSGASYQVTVSNLGSGPSSGMVTVTDTLPAGLIGAAIAGTGWNCTLATLSCTRGDSLPASASYAVIAITVTVAGNAPAQVANQASVSGGGSPGASANDLTTIATQTVTGVAFKGAIFRSGLWVIDRNGDYRWNGPPVDLLASLGQSNDISVVGDWNGDGRAKAGIFRAGMWVLDYNGNGQWDGPSLDRFFTLGQAGDIPVVGDWNGDGRTKVGVFRNGQWILDCNGNGLWDGPSTDRSINLGQAGDTPVVGDWNGTNFSKVGIFRAGLWVLDYNGNGLWDGQPGDRFFYLGQAGDTAVIGDWNGDSRANVGIFRAGLWVLDYNGNGQWDGPSADRVFTLGQAGDIPVVGDWNGDGHAKAGIFRAGLWVLDKNGNGQWDGSPGDVSFYLGQAGDVPAVGKWQ